SALDGSANGISKAVDRAVAWASTNKYEFNKTGATITRADVRFAVNLSSFDGGTGVDEATAAASPATIRYVQVSVPPKSISVFFAMSGMGGSSVGMTRRAVAGQSVAINRFCNIAPFSIVQDPTGQPLDVDPGCPNSQVFTKGCTYSFRLSGGNGVS